MAQSPSEQKRMAPWAMLGPGVRLGGQGWPGQVGSERAACSSDRPKLIFLGPSPLLFTVFSAAWEWGWGRLEECERNSGENRMPEFSIPIHLTPDKVLPLQGFGFIFKVD